MKQLEWEILPHDGILEARTETRTTYIIFGTHSFDDPPNYIGKYFTFDKVGENSSVVEGVGLVAAENFREEILHEGNLRDCIAACDKHYEENQDG